MNRLHTYKQNPEIQQALLSIPKPLHRFLYCDWCIGADPVYIGLHNFDDTGNERSYRDTAHVVYPFHIACDRKETTLVLPVVEGVKTVVHELGHVLHYNLGFPDPVLSMVSDYAGNNRWELYAEAFTVYCLPWIRFENSNYWEIDEVTKGYFDHLVNQLM